MNKRISGQKVRVAMIGAGSMANKVHYPSLASFPDVEFAGICDLNPQALQLTAEKYGIEKKYSDYRKMIEETSPDAVYAIGGPDVMYPVWTWCLKQGQNLYIEKPLGITLHQARALAYLAEKQDLYHPGQLSETHLPAGSLSARCLPETRSNCARGLPLL